MTCEKTPKILITLLVMTLSLAALVLPGRHAVAAATATASAAPDFSLSVTPASRTVKRGSGTLYDITIQSLNGFNGTVNFQVSGLCPACTEPFVPGTVTGSGTTGFSIQTQKHQLTPIGTFTITVVATSGSLSHSAQVTLVTR